MAVILRSNTDLVYLPDHGFVGEEGALRILPQITRHIHRIDISHNLLGSAGTLTLFKGLSTLRLRHSSPELGLGLWGLTEVNLGMNGLDDIALDGVLAYAKKDVLLKRILVQGNEIKFEEKNIESIINSLNSSNIESLSLVNNIYIKTKGLIKFLNLLNCSTLKSLNLSACNLNSTISESISKFIISKKSRNLENLELNGNHLGSEGISKIINSIENYNFTLTSIGLLANHSLSEQIINLEQEQEQEQEEINLNQEYLIDKKNENKIIEYQIHQRLPNILERNKNLNKRIRKASLNVNVPAKIIFNAKSLTNEEIAKNVINDISNNSSSKGIFRLFELPEEIIHLIIRYTSQDPWAFNDSQWTKIRKDSIDRDNLKKMYRLRIVRSRGKMIDEIKGVNREMREEWLRKNKLDKWER
ncbi:uncharacterized protein I206_105792 [Kwoniella pini CBS 10737]|uniref:Uncharacterized protein n=1 Tax=Kwoniella pini CBS 10737 TaxID=1296096 RepID=A0A1B9I086_9TREE|nr:uncharacterized protein I206_04612 [Kwoniella pini CBS 10737]OCF48925.1 hypothetical protein I206_04612 [Kwoniella pini CBS 10737]